MTFGTIRKSLATNYALLLVLHELDSLSIEGLLEFR